MKQKNVFFSYCGLPELKNLAVYIAFIYYLAVWHQYDDAVFPPANWFQYIRNKIPFLKSMDPIEGRNIATWAMLPRWRGFVNETEDTNMSAWDAVLAIRALEHCMTQTLMEEGGRVFKNVPPSYDFTWVSEGFFLPTSTNKLSVYYFILIENDNLGDWSPEKDCFW